jgi:hypothetical protein
MRAGKRAPRRPAYENGTDGGIYVTSAALRGLKFRPISQQTIAGFVRKVVENGKGRPLVR